MYTLLSDCMDLLIEMLFHLLIIGETFLDTPLSIVEGLQHMIDCPVSHLLATVKYTADLLEGHSAPFHLSVVTALILALLTIYILIKLTYGSIHLIQGTITMYNVELSSIYTFAPSKKMHKEQTPELPVNFCANLPYLSQEESRAAFAFPQSQTFSSSITSDPIVSNVTMMLTYLRLKILFVKRTSRLRKLKTLGCHQSNYARSSFDGKAYTKYWMETRYKTNKAYHPEKQGDKEDILAYKNLVAEEEMKTVGKMQAGELVTKEKKLEICESTVEDDEMEAENWELDIGKLAVEDREFESEKLAADDEELAGDNWELDTGKLAVEDREFESEELTLEHEELVMEEEELEEDEWKFEIVIVEVRLRQEELEVEEWLMEELETEEWLVEELNVEATDVETSSVKILAEENVAGPTSSLFYQASGDVSNQKGSQTIPVLSSLCGQENAHSTMAPCVSFPLDPGCIEDINWLTLALAENASEVSLTDEELIAICSSPGVPTVPEHILPGFVDPQMMHETQLLFTDEELLAMASFPGIQAVPGVTLSGLMDPQDMHEAQSLFTDEESLAMYSFPRPMGPQPMPEAPSFLSNETLLALISLSGSQPLLSDDEFLALLALMSPIPDDTGYFSYISNPPEIKRKLRRAKSGIFGKYLSNLRQHKCVLNTMAPPSPSSIKRHQRWRKCMHFMDAKGLLWWFKGVTQQGCSPHSSKVLLDEDVPNNREFPQERRLPSPKKAPRSILRKQSENSIAASTKTKKSVIWWDSAPHDDDGLTPSSALYQPFQVIEEGEIGGNFIDKISSRMEVSAEEKMGNQLEGLEATIRGEPSVVGDMGKEWYLMEKGLKTLPSLTDDQVDEEKQRLNFCDEEGIEARKAFSFNAIPIAPASKKSLLTRLRVSKRFSKSKPSSTSVVSLSKILGAPKAHMPARLGSVGKDAGQLRKGTTTSGREVMEDVKAKKGGGSKLKGKEKLKNPLARSKKSKRIKLRRPKMMKIGNRWLPVLRVGSLPSEDEPESVSVSEAWGKKRHREDDLSEQSTISRLDGYKSALGNGEGAKEASDESRAGTFKTSGLFKRALKRCKRTKGYERPADEGMNDERKQADENAKELKKRTELAAPRDMVAQGGEHAGSKGSSRLKSIFRPRGGKVGPVEASTGMKAKRSQKSIIQSRMRGQYTIHSTCSNVPSPHTASAGSVARDKSADISIH